MSPEAFRLALAQLGVSAGYAAPLFGKSRSQAYRYLRGESPIPEAVARKIQWEVENTGVCEVSYGETRRWAAHRDGVLLGYYDDPHVARAASLDMPR